MTERIAYIDTVSTAMPTHGAEPWRAHCIRVAIALEEDRKIVGAVLRLVRQYEPVQVDTQWTARYGVPESVPVEETDAPLTVAQNVATMILGARCVAQNAPFHRSVIDGLFEDAGVPVVQSDGWYCAQTNARPLVDARTIKGAKKAPTIAESYRFFAHETMPLITTLGWREAALWQLNALRAIYWGILGQGLPSDGIEDPATT